MKILQILTYYRPHMSGLTIYVERLSRALVSQGHDVTVLTSHYEKSLPMRETVDGVNVIRVPVLLRVSKGVIMPTFGLAATRHALAADVMHLHLPQFDAPGLALRGRLFRKPVVLTYHCDLQLPSSLFNRLVDRVVALMNRAAGELADAVVTYTRDYGANSPFLAPYLGEKLHIIPPPVELAQCPKNVAQAFRLKHDLAGKRVIGIAARLAAEKGVEVLLQALPQVLAAPPNTIVLHAGPTENVLGEEAYAARLRPLFERYRDVYLRLGLLQGEELTAFYQNIDCLVIPSLNSTESFGLVQIEAMRNGAPVVASDLPGVRQPVSMTGMGRIAGVGDADGLARALIAILNEREAYVRRPALIAAAFSPQQTATSYLALYRALQEGSRRTDAPEPEAYVRLREMRDAAAAGEDDA
jgi:glycosyltransferase involved in cell wall biosynthesis